jgi:hypothetical protein
VHYLKWLASIEGGGVGTHNLLTSRIEPNIIGWDGIGIYKLNVQAWISTFNNSIFQKFQFAIKFVVNIGRL